MLLEQKLFTWGEEKLRVEVLKDHQALGPLLLCIGITCSSSSSTSRSTTGQETQVAAAATAASAVLPVAVAPAETLDDRDRGGRSIGPAK